MEPISYLLVITLICQPKKLLSSKNLYLKNRSQKLYLHLNRPTREEPVDFQPLDTDRVFYEDADYLTGKFIFDDAGSAIKSEEVKSWFVFWEEWIREWCGKAEQPLWDDSPTLLFTNRQARVDFLLALPGKV